jgi:AcrR family transcriptional regulator
MAYMARGERRLAILDAALRVARREGFAGMTTRRIGAELGAATAHVHHHFGSANELRREAFRRFAELELGELISKSQDLAPAERLRFILDLRGPALDDSSIRLWSDAWDEAQHEPEFGQVYAEALASLHGIIVSILEAGRENGTIAPTAEISTVAWELLALAHGLGSFAALKNSSLQLPEAAEILRNAVSREVR